MIWLAEQASDARPLIHHHEMRAGDNFAHTYTFTDSAGVLVDVSSWSVAARVDPELAATPSVPFTVTLNSTGVVTVSATAAELSGVPAGLKHWWEFVRADLDETCFAGRFKVFADRASA